MSEVTPPTLAEVTAEGAFDVGRRYVHDLREHTDEVLRVHGHGQLELYEKILDDEQTLACFNQLRSSIVARETRVEPGGDSELDARAADYIRTIVESSVWDQACWKMLVGVMFGFGVAECLFELRGSMVHLSGLRVRRAARFRWTRGGELRLMRDDGTPIALPPRKMWTFSIGAHHDDDPYGRGLAHWLYWPTWFKRNAIRFWAVHLERFSGITPVASVPPGTYDTETERQKLLRTLHEIRGGGAIVIPKGIDLELAQALRDSGGDYEKFVNLMNAAISKIILQQTMTTDDGASLSQAQVHAKVSGYNAKAIADILCESFRQGPVRWLVEWNFPGAKLPMLYRDFSESVDLAALAQRDQALAGIGWRPTEQRIREVYGDGYEPAPPPAAAPGFGAAFAEARSMSQDIGDTLDNEWEQTLGPQIAAIQKLIDGSRNLNEVRARLSELENEDPTALTASLARAMFAARVGGQADFDADEKNG